MPDKPESFRRRQAAEQMAAPRLDALLVTRRPNVRYLTGFTGSNAALLLSREGSAILVTDPRYTVQAAQQVDCAVKIAKGSLLSAVMGRVRRSGFQRIGFEREHMTVSAFEAAQKDLPVGAELLAASGVIEQLRMIKDEQEIGLIRDSVLLNSKALAAALRRLKPGMREAEFAAEIDYQSRRLGAEGPAFDTIVASGARAALPHAQPGEERIERGMLLIDMGAFRRGYASDMTRMIYLGSAPQRYRRCYRAVLEAQQAAIDSIREGVMAAAVDRAARNVLKKHGLEREFIHSTGHGLGLEIHEPPRIGARDQTRLVSGMAVTVEPGIYTEGWGGIRIEDTVLVTANGCEILTPTSKALIEI